jgi:NAD(P)-dependent dehydrogenase (short-subunit alcohol dehydrogenase family)
MAARMLALVTGASRGLGKLCAQELAKASADLLLVARDRTRLCDAAAAITAREPGVRVETLCCDLADPTAPQRVQDAADALGGADILVNNAAIQGPIGRAWEIPWPEFERAIRLDFCVPVALCRALVPGMKAKGRGWIVNISGGGATAPRAMFAAYASAKTALVRFSETLAIETAPYGIRINAVAPGAFASGMTRAVDEAGANAGIAELSTAQGLLDRGDKTNARKAARLVAYLTLGEGRDISGKLISAAWDQWESFHRNTEVLMHRDVYALRRIIPEDRHLHLDD